MRGNEHLPPPLTPRTCFCCVQEYVVTFNSVRPIYEYSQTWDFKAYKAQQHSVTTLREQMQRIGVWVNELEKMRARQPCGILEVSGLAVPPC